MGFKSGWLKVGSWHGAPVRLHWTIPVAAFFFGKFEIKPAFWFAYFLLVLIHEFGHALLVRRFKLTVRTIDVTGLGGLCTWVGDTTPLRRSLIAWGGVVAQAIVLASTYLAALAFGPPQEEFTSQIYWAFTHTNIWLIGLNLLPIAPLDGEEAWKLLPMVWKRLKASIDQRQVAAAAKREEAKRRKAANRDLEKIAQSDDLGASEPIADEVAKVLQAATLAANEASRRKKTDQ